MTSLFSICQSLGHEYTIDLDIDMAIFILCETCKFVEYVYNKVDKIWFVRHPCTSGGFLNIEESDVPKEVASRVYGLY